MKEWYSFLDSTTYNGNEPAFYMKDSLPWVKTLENNSNLIMEELKNLISNSQEFQPYFSGELNKSKSWKTFVLKWWGIDFFSAQKKCPQTSKIINQIPGLVSASFSLMEGNSKIPEHQGDTNAIYRAHLGLIIPSVLPECGFTVKNESKSWEEGKTLVFCDAHQHSAFNHSNQDRVILIIDIVREEYLYKSPLICANVMASLFLQKRIKYFPFLKLLPKWAIRIIHFCTKINALWFIPFRNEIYAWKHKNNSKPTF